ncbi:ABC transporter permease [Crossiella cryophila]|uniref:Peptide/nickel transport system permease protein n=1 Tax=Crossiella cryophila TaxID=43355 RepID=A0A7W7CEC5_9PSEU|nr:ABC transporter permease [Crossiella cryophila]MBB4678258.1 peptide/nickel transport system permease protein [Crossiella cryophila]
MNPGLALVLRRTALSGGLLVLLTVVVYVGVDLLPGDPVTARLGPNTSPARIAEIRDHLGLDRPVLTRYTEWAWGLLHGDLGHAANHRPVTEVLSDRIGNSLLLAVLAVLLLAPLSVFFGVLAAWHRGRATDRIVSSAALTLVSLPEFVVAGALVVVFATGLGWLPALSFVPAGVSPLAQPAVLVLPVLSLLLVGLAYAVRVIRACAVATLRSPQVEFLTLNGTPPLTIALRAVVPSVLPVAVQVWLISASGFVGGAVLVEQVFGYPGVGELLVTSVRSGDLPVVQALVVVLGGGMLLALVLADLAAVLLTPRLRTAVTG